MAFAARMSIAGGRRQRQTPYYVLYLSLSLNVILISLVLWTNHTGIGYGSSNQISSLLTISSSTPDDTSTAAAAPVLNKPEPVLHHEPVEPAATEWWKKEKPLLSDWPDLPTRNDIHQYLEKLGFTKGAEIGVQRGLLARKTLRTWRSCKDYKLIDLWGQEEGYKEPGKDTNERKSLHLENARRILKRYKGIVDWYIMRSTDAAKKMPESYFDYIYVDARHDYCAVTEDLEYYWPKLRPGGIMAGHDYVTTKEAMHVLGPAEDWSKCEDGRVEPRAVRGAVDDFAAKHNNLAIKTTNEGFSSWLMQKPYDDK